MTFYNTFVTYNGNGTTTDFSIPFSYLDQDEVIVIFSGPTSYTYTLPSPNVVRTSPAIATGESVTIRRSTDIASARVVFADGSPVTGSQLNNAVSQLLYGMQESADSVVTAEESALIAANAAAAATLAAANANSAANAALSAVSESASALNFVSANANFQFNSLKVTSGTYANLWTQAPAGKISHYFMFAAMTLSNQFTSGQILDAAAAALKYLLVSPRFNSAAYDVGVKVTINSMIFECSTAGTTGASAPSTAGITTAGQTFTDGTVVWRYSGKTVPAAWQWFFVDYDPVTSQIIYPDSNDAYAGVILSALGRANPSAGWLSTSSGHATYSRAAALAEAQFYNISLYLSVGLASTFQDLKTGTGATYDVRFLADNVEVWRGCLAGETIFSTAGDATTQARCAADRAALRLGIFGLWDTTYQTFKTYLGDPDVPSYQGLQGFTDRTRFMIWPILHGMITNYSEWATYADPVMRYTLERSPEIINSDVGEFVMAEWYYAAASVYKLRWAKNTLSARVSNRSSGFAIISDVALNLDMN